MLSDRVQRQIDRLLDQAEEAIALRQWADLRAHCEVVLNLDPDNSDAAQYLALAEKSSATAVVSNNLDLLEPSEDPTPEFEGDTSVPVAPPDATSEAVLVTNPIDPRTSGSRVRELMVANTKLAREQSDTPEARLSRDIRKQREASRASRGQVRKQVRERLDQASKPRSRNDVRKQREASDRSRRQVRKQVQERISQASKPRSRNLDSHTGRSPADSQTFFNQLIGTAGRINRMGYLIRILASTVVAYVAVVLMGTESLGGPIGFAVYIAVLVVAFCSAVRRFHDINWGGISILLLFIPLVNIVIAFMLIFRSGTRGTNDYGNEPEGLTVGF